MIITRIHRNLDDVLHELIERKQIVAIFQGQSEWGPRALGNRSILFDPRHSHAKQIVNEVKRREDYRPFAGTILEEHAHEYFEMYCFFFQTIFQLAYDEIPSLVHADGTCRIQTVNREQNKNYYDLIKGFGDITGTPIIFNTSFNLGGEALVENIFDAIDTCNRSEINHLYIPEDQEIAIPYELCKDKRTNYPPQDDNR